ncbi:MAG: ribosomal protein S18-alanine N-acetyltransferase [Chloroflexota bacterium]
MPLILRYMRLSDVQEVVAIDRESFSTPWPARSYNYEIAESTHSYMVVLHSVPDRPGSEGRSLRRLIRGFTGSWETGGTLLAYGGLWKILEEAHISTIATHLAHRGKGYGEVVLAAMISKAIALEASYVVLEVRVSNTIAQNLYTKYGFTISDVKRNYYRDDNEDAYDMRLDLHTPGIIDNFMDRWARIQARIPFTDVYTTVPHPREKR